MRLEEVEVLADLVLKKEIISWVGELEAVCGLPNYRVKLLMGWIRWSR